MKIRSDDCASLEQGQIRFYDNYVPTLEAADYLINVTQRVNPVTSPAVDDCYAASQIFSVRGPRYALPPGDVFSVFPPNNAQGVFDQFLPNVVLTARELPWERNVFSDPDASRQTPWLALVLFVDGEQAGGKDALLTPQVENWSPNRTRSATIPAADFFDHPTGEGILWPALQAEWYESEDYLQKTLCSIVDVSPEAFATLVPSKADLPYLAHVRQVDPSAKDTSVLKVSGDGWYSVIVGNRLPDAPPAGSTAPGRLNIVHMVSLEGFEQFVAGAPLPRGTARVRLISLESWTFTCLPEAGESFSEAVNSLLADAHGDRKSTSFALPVEVADPYGAGQYVAEALQSGYVPLSYQTRQGEQTFAWYRGPFSPVPVQNFISSTQQTPDDPANWTPFERASSAIIFDKEYGIFDVSYGVAWETGRLLALSNAQFGQELLEWQRGGHSLIDLILERKSQIAALSTFDPDDPDPVTEKTLVDQIRAYAVTGDFMRYLVTQFSAQIAPALTEPQPAAAAPPFPPYAALPPPPADPQTIADLLAETDVQELVRAQGSRQLDDIADWLAQKYLLIGVPFENLVPSADLLPNESIRFFYLDSNWLDALVEGALSVGIESSRDQVYQDLMKGLIWNTTFAAVQTTRDSLLGEWAAKTPSGSTVPFEQESIAGMLVRSAIVAGWPGLEIRAYVQTMPGSAEPDPSSHIGLLRMERLSGDVLLCLWPAVPAVVTLGEPREGVAFGFEDPPGEEAEGYYLYLRSLDPDDYGTELSRTQYAVDAGKSIVDSQTRLVKITGEGGLVEAIRNALPGSPVLSVRDLAVQMIKVPEQGVFAAPPAAPD